jgi:hypothetical protein
MTWHADLTPRTYGGVAPPGPPTLHVGWLSKAHPFPTGDAPAAFIERLDVLAKHGIANESRSFPFCCELCDQVGQTEAERTERASYAEIRAVALDGTRLAAPMLIRHYVTAHRYRPPQVFIDAVLRVASLRWEDAWARDLCLGCATPGTRTVPGEVIGGDGVRGLLFYLQCAACAASFPRFTPYTV